MSTKNAKISEYIQSSASFAKPILHHFRTLVHEVCPETEEKIKWGFPHFDYLGGPMCSMASFKQHCAIGFWKASLMKNGKKLVEMAKSEEAMGHLGKLTSLKDLPGDAILKSYLREAMRLNEEGIKLKPKKASSSQLKEIQVPEDFRKFLSLNKKALKYFEKLPMGHKKEYVAWIEGAKTESTRLKRIANATERLQEGTASNRKHSL
jgi:uncharacterized protein YdeI (YjbR/CyaY-like superfamily)